MTGQRCNQLRKVTEVLREGDRFLVAGHIAPDFDCVGSVLAVDWALRQLGKTSVPVVAGPVSPKWDFLPHRHRLRPLETVRRHEWDNIVVVDGDLGRAGLAAEWIQTARSVVNIDHHPTNSSGPEANLLLVPEASATGELIYDLIVYLGLSFDAEVATLLYTAIVSDTGSFRYNNTTERALRLAADLVKLGAKPAHVAEHLYQQRSWSYVEFLKRALQTLERSEDGQAAWLTLSYDLLSETTAYPEETEGIIQYAQMIAGVELAVVFRETEPGEVRVSFRSRSRFDVSALAREFGGGGHVRAAGCRLRLPLEQARQAVLARVAEILRQ